MTPNGSRGVGMSRRGDVRVQQLVDVIRPGLVLPFRDEHVQAGPEIPPVPDSTTAPAAPISSCTACARRPNSTRPCDRPFSRSPRAFGQLSPTTADTTHDTPDGNTTSRTPHPHTLAPAHPPAGKQRSRGRPDSGRPGIRPQPRTRHPSRPRHVPACSVWARTRAGACRIRPRRLPVVPALRHLGSARPSGRVNFDRSGNSDVLKGSGPTPRAVIGPQTTMNPMDEASRVHGRAGSPAICDTAKCGPPMSNGRPLRTAHAAPVRSSTAVRSGSTWWRRGPCNRR